MRVQLLGPISGLPNFNDDNFARVKADLESKGHEVWSPHERTEEQIAEATALDVAGDIGSLQVHHFWLRISLEKLCSGWPTFACVLDGWENSKGASLEMLIAYQIGVGVVTEHGKELDKFRYEFTWTRAT